MRRFWERLAGDDNGATAIEYALIAGLIFVSIVGALTTFSDEVRRMLTLVSDTVINAN